MCFISVQVIISIIIIIIIAFVTYVMILFFIFVGRWSVWGKIDVELYKKKENNRIDVKNSLHDV